MITKNTPLSEVLRLSPRVRDIFVRHGMGCSGCMGSATETLAHSARLHGINVEVLIRELNEVLLEK